MPNKMTPKLHSHRGLTRPGKMAHYLCDDYEVLHQDQPTERTPISAHKQMAGHRHPGKLPHYHG